MKTSFPLTSTKIVVVVAAAALLCRPTSSFPDGPVLGSDQQRRQALYNMMEEMAEQREEEQQEQASRELLQAEATSDSMTNNNNALNMMMREFAEGDMGEFQYSGEQQQERALFHGDSNVQAANSEPVAVAASPSVGFNPLNMMMNEFEGEQQPVAAGEFEESRELEQVDPAAAAALPSGTGGNNALNMMMKEFAEGGMGEFGASGEQPQRELFHSDPNVEAVNQMEAAATPDNVGFNPMNMMMNEFQAEQQEAAAGGEFDRPRELAQVATNTAAEEPAAAAFPNMGGFNPMNMMMNEFQVEQQEAAATGEFERPRELAQIVTNAAAEEPMTAAAASPSVGGFNPMNMMMNEFQVEQQQVAAGEFERSRNLAQMVEEPVTATMALAAPSNAADSLSSVMSEFQGEGGSAPEAPTRDVFTESPNETSFASVPTEVVANQEQPQQEAPANSFLSMFQEEMTKDHKYDLTFDDPSKMTTTTGKKKAIRYAIEFDECKNLTLEECMTEIEGIKKEYPDLFAGVESFNFNVNTFQQPGAPNAHHIGLKANTAGTHVAGHNGDGIVNYHNPNFGRKPVWCTSNEPCPNEENRLRHIEDQCCFHVGPWDCDPGYPKTADECCAMIKASMPGRNQDGKEIHCHVAYPIGSAQNPVDFNRVNILLDANGNVIGEPSNE